MVISRFLFLFFIGASVNNAHYLQDFDQNNYNSVLVNVTSNENDADDIVDASELEVITDEQADERDEDDEVTEEPKEGSISMKESAKKCTKIAEDMGKAGRLSGTEKGITKITDKMIEKGNDIDIKKKGKKGLAVLDAASSGMVTLVKGIQSGSWQDCVTGVLNMIGSLAALTGPVGMLVSVAFSMFSMLFGLFGGSTGGEESTEDIIKRVLENALKDAKSDELRAEGAGLRKIYGSVSKSIQNFRKLGEIEPEEAMNLYNFAFVGIRFFGVLEFYIVRDCNIGDASTYEDKDLKEKSNRCLEFLNLYCDLSILRQMLMIDLASFLMEKKLNATYKNLLELVAKEQRFDMKYLLFLYDPINYPDNRYISAKYVAAPEKYSTIGKYMEKLDEIYSMNSDGCEIEAPELITPMKLPLDDVDNKPHLFKRMVMLCSDVAAKGSCFEQTKTGIFSEIELNGWAYRIRSIFITARRKVYIHTNVFNDVVRVGPFYGPGIFSFPVWDIKSLEINSTYGDGEKSNSFLKVCIKPDMDMTDTCFNFGPGDQHTLKREGVSNHVKRWDKKVRSFSLPPNLKLERFSGENFKPVNGTTQQFFYGPLVTNVDSRNNWMSLRVIKTTRTSASMVKICRGENLSGFCTYVVPPYEKRVKPKEIDLKSIQGVNWTIREKRLKSMNVPGGLHVKLVSKVTRNYGPYIGPITINKVDGEDDIMTHMFIARL